MSSGLAKGFELWDQQNAARRAAEQERARADAKRERDRARKYRAENRAALNAFKITEICTRYGSPGLAADFIRMNARPAQVRRALYDHDDDDMALEQVRDERFRETLEDVDSDQLWSDALEQARRGGGNIRRGER